MRFRTIRGCLFLEATLAVFLMLGGPVRAETPNPDLMVWYNFEETVGNQFADLSGHRNHARVVGNVSRIKGKNGQAVFFNGKGSHLDCGSNESLRLMSDFTLSLWVKMQPSPQPYPVITSWRKPGDKTYAGWSFYAGCPGEPGFYPIFVTDPNGEWLRGYGPNVDDDKWIHYCFTVDRNNIGTFYINGRKHENRMLLKPVTTHDGNLVIGVYSADAENYCFRGAVDEFRLYKRALTEGEITDVYQAGLAGIYAPEDVALQNAVKISPVLAEYGLLQWGNNRVLLRCEIPKEAFLRCSQARLILEKDGREMLSKSVVVENGTWQTVNFKIPNLAPGNYILLNRIDLLDGRILKTARQSVSVCRRLVAETEVDRIEKGDIYILDDFAKFNPSVVVPAIKKNSWSCGKYRFPGSNLEKSYLTADGLVSILRWPVPFKGWYAVYLGLLNPGKGIQATLAKSKEPFKQYQPVQTFSGLETVIEEKFLKYAELEGSEILSLNASSRLSPAGLAYIKFICLTDKQIALVNKQDDISVGKKFIPYNDGEIFIFQTDSLSKTIPEYITAYKNKLDIFDTFAVTAGACVMYYNTKVGTVIGVPEEAANKIYQTNLRQWLTTGNDTLKLAAETAHAHGIRLEANLRMNWTSDKGHAWNSSFRNENQDRFGLAPWPNASKETALDYFYPEVREERYRLFKEIASNYEIDIVNFDFSRWPRVMGMAAAETFQQKFGRPPDLFAEGGDQEWYRYQSGFITDLMRKTRRMLDEEGKRKGKRIEMWAIVNYWHYLPLATDVETWVKEDLVDALVVGNRGVTYAAEDYCLDKIRPLVKGTKCKVYVRSDLYLGKEDPTTYKGIDRPLWPSLDEIKRMHLNWFQQGAYGVYMYNMGLFRDASLYQNLERWAEFEAPESCPIVPIVPEL